MNKKQVGALLKVMGNDDHRPVLKSAYVDEYKDELVLVATDGYKLVAVNLDEDARPLVGRMIRREAIERWYKLATGKSRLTSDELVAVSADDYSRNNGYQEGEYVKWQGIVPDKDRATGQAVSFNAEFVKLAQDVDGSTGLVWYFGQPLEPMMATTERGLYIVMPLKQ